MLDILIPLYNNQDYIENCISSIKSQTYKDYTVYIINDGSTDISEAVAMRVIGNDKRFKLISRKNKGVSATRQELIDISTSPYIFFMDSDDYLYENTSLEKMMKIQDELNPDMLITPIIKNIGGKIISNRNTDGSIKTVNTEQALSDLFYIRYNGASLIGAILKRQLFEREKFREGIIYEDADIFYRLMLHARKITYYNIPTYVYVIQKNSIMRGNFSEKNMVLLDISRRTVDDIGKIYTHLAQATLYNLNNNCLELLRLKVLSDNPYDDKGQIIKEIRKYKNYIIHDSNARKGKIIQTIVASMGEKYFKLLMLIYIKVLHRF